MGLVSGSAACTRFNVISLPDNPEFELIPFRPIMPGSSIREKEGFIPYEPGESFEIGARCWAFRIRTDKVVLDGTAIAERVLELVKAETESVGPPSPKLRQQLRLQAEEEMMQHPMPRSHIIECLMEETVLYVGSTAKGQLGMVLEMLKRIGVEVEFKTPWLDSGQEEELSELVEIKEPGQSILGAEFLKKLLNDPDTFVEADKGSVKMVTGDGAKVGLAGPVLNEVDRLIDQGALVLSAKLMVEGFAFSFDAFSFRFSGLKLDNLKSRHWIERLETRMEKIKALWDWLDNKYQLLMLKQQGEDPGSDLDE